MKKPEETKEKIIRVAIQLFATKGFKGTSVREIAKITKMTPWGIYYHFQNKEGLIFAVLQNHADRFIAKIEEVLEQDIHPLERFKLLIKTHLDFHANHIKEGKIFFLDEDVFSSKYMKKINAYQTKIFSIYLRALENLNAQGYTKCPFPRVTLFFVLTAVNGLVRWYRPSGKLSIDQISQIFVDLILFGMTEPPTTKQRKSRISPTK